MGTHVHVLLPERHQAAVLAVRALFADWELRLSRFLPDSELSRLNARAGQPVAVSRLLLRVAGVAVEAARATDGAFDPTLGSQQVRIGYDRSFDEMPRVGRATQTPATPGGAWRDVVLDAASRTITMPKRCALDLGGIAKGMAVDATIDLLGTRGVEGALVSAGGDLAVCGTPPDGGAWPVLVGMEPGAQVVSLVRGALATSGIARRRWRQGTTPRHHIVDPRTGEPVESDLYEVTVAASTCATAEAGATAAFVLGPRRGADFLRQNGLAGSLTRLDGTRAHIGPWPSPGPEAA